MWILLFFSRQCRVQQDLYLAKSSLSILQAVSIGSCFENTVSLYDNAKDIAHEEFLEREIFGEEDDSAWIQSSTREYDEANDAPEDEEENRNFDNRES